MQAAGDTGVKLLETPGSELVEQLQRLNPKSKTQAAFFVLIPITFLLCAGRLSSLLPYFFISFSVVLTCIQVRCRRNRETIANKIIQIGDVSDIPTICNMDDVDSEVAVARALAGLLKLITPENAEALTYGSRLALFRVLRQRLSSVSDLQHAFLDCLGRVGNAADMTEVRAVANRRSMTPAAAMLSSHAKEVLEEMETRLRPYLQHTYLLRPGSAEDAQSNELLRAGRDTGAEEQMLVRAVGSSESEV